MAVTTDQALISQRSVAGFTAMDSSKVVIFTGARGCRKIVDAINNKMSTPGRARLVRAVQMGTSGFLAYDPAMVGENPMSEWTPVFALSKTYKFTLGILAF